MGGARRCNVVGERPLVVLLGDIQDWGIAICCCTKFVQKIITACTCKMYSDLYDGIHPITRWGTLTKATEVDMETEPLKRKVFVYQTECGFKFFHYDAAGELTDGDIAFDSLKQLTAKTGLVLDPNFSPRSGDK